MKNTGISVIGAGISGLVAASLLSEQGYNVDLFEKNESPGGRIRVLKQDGFTFDMGPSWYWMPDIIEAHFKMVGHSASDFYELTRLDPSYTVFWKDEPPLVVPADIRQLDEWFEAREPGSSLRLKKFLEEAEDTYQTGMQLLVQNPLQRLSDYLDPGLLVKAFKMNLFTSMHKYLTGYFQDPKILALLGFPVLFLGGTVHQIPSLYSLMNYADMKLGTWYPSGGMASLSKAWYQIALERGVRFHFDTPVSQIVVDKKRVTGILTEKDSAIFRTDGMVATGDYNHMEQHLLPEAMRTYSPAYWEKRTLSPSALLFYVGVNRKISGLSHHNLFFDENMENHSKSIYQNPDWPENPLFYVCCPSKTDPDVAPSGCENLFVLIPVAPGLRESEDIHRYYLDLVLDRLKTNLDVDIRSDIRFSRSFGIEDFKREYHSYKGNAYGLANTWSQTAGLKPSMRHPDIPNLVFAGQMTHPGPGIPPSMMSGRIAAELLSQSMV